jgi:hypothetical protein
MTAFEEADLNRLAELVRQRRVDLRLGIEPAAKLAEMSKDTWKRVEAGLTVRATTYPGIERVLQWAPGSCMQIIQGAVGPVVVQPAGEGIVIAEDLAGQVEDSVKLAAIAVSDNLTAAEIRDLSQRVLEELKRRGAI